MNTKTRTILAIEASRCYTLTVFVSVCMSANYHIQIKLVIFVSFYFSDRVARVLTCSNLLFLAREKNFEILLWVAKVKAYMHGFVCFIMWLTNLLDLVRRLV
jgi:hypothetical protein